ncbi:hypothetical protein Tco_1209449 [Tanacetum coccineum]
MLGKHMAGAVACHGKGANSVWRASSATEPDVLSFIPSTVVDVTKKNGYKGWILDNLNDSCRFLLRVFRSVELREPVVFRCGREIVCVQN